MPGFVNYIKGALDSQPQVIKLTMVGGSLRVLRLLPPLKTGRHDITEILLKVALNIKNQIKSNQYQFYRLWLYLTSAQIHENSRNLELYHFFSTNLIILCTGTIRKELSGIRRRIGFSFCDTRKNIRSNSFSLSNCSNKTVACPLRNI